MEIESFRESCAACGSRTIHFVMDPPFAVRHCAGCGRDNSETWGREYMPGYPLTPRWLENVPKKYLLHDADGTPIGVKVGTPVPLSKPWDRLSNFERSQHFTDAALHE